MSVKRLLISNYLQEVFEANTDPFAERYNTKIESKEIQSQIWSYS